MEEIVAVRTFRSRLPVRRVRHMDRRGQEVQNNFLTDHIIKFLSGSPVRSPKGRQKRSERPSADRFQAVSDTIARDRRLFPSWTLFAPQSLQAGHGDRKTKHAIRLRKANTFGNVRWITRQGKGKMNILITLSWCRWTPSAAPPMALLAPQIDHNY